MFVNVRLSVCGKLKKWPDKDGDNPSSGRAEEGVYDHPPSTSDYTGPIKATVSRIFLALTPTCGNMENITVGDVTASIPSLPPLGLTMEY